MIVIRHKCGQYYDFLVGVSGFRPSEATERHSCCEEMVPSRELDTEREENKPTSFSRRLSLILFSYTPGGVWIERCSSVRSLGAMCDDRPTFEDHMASVSCSVMHVNMHVLHLHLNWRSFRLWYNTGEHFVFTLLSVDCGALSLSLAVNRRPQINE